jgi:hypothetical protein
MCNENIADGYTISTLQAESATIIIDMDIPPTTNMSNGCCQNIHPFLDMEITSAAFSIDPMF